MQKIKTPLLILAAFLLGILSVRTIQIIYAHGGNTNLIHACVKNGNGDLRIVDVNKNCKDNETALEWNSQGAPGLGGFVSNLVGTDFYSADLRYRNLEGDNLTDASFSFAYLVGVNFNSSNLTNTSFVAANAKKAKFTNATFSNTNLQNVNLIETEMPNLNLSTSIIAGADFSGSNLAGSTFPSSPGSIFYQANLTGANFTGSTVGQSNFDGANLTNANMTNANLFSAANLSTATRTGIIWSNTICPDGTNSNNNGSTCEGHL